MSHTADDGDTLLQKSASEGTKVPGARTEHKKVWPLDPIAIKYFEKHPELNDIWYHRPFTK